MLSILLVVVVLMLLFGTLPTWSYSESWGYFPAGTFGTVLLVLVVLAVAGRI